MELAVTLALIIIVAALAAWYGLQLDSPNTRDALTLRCRNTQDR